MQPQEPTTPTFLGFPLNRIVAFAGPHIAWISGVIATWLINNVHILGTGHFGKDKTAAAIAKVITFVLVTLVTYVGQHKWLDGWQKWEQQVVTPGVAFDPATDPVNDPLTDPATLGIGQHPDGANYSPDDFTPEGVPKGS